MRNLHEQESLSQQFLSKDARVASLVIDKVLLPVLYIVAGVLHLAADDCIFRYHVQMIGLLVTPG